MVQRYLGLRLARRVELALVQAAAALDRRRPARGQVRRARRAQGGCADSAARACEREGRREQGGPCWRRSVRPSGRAVAAVHCSDLLASHSLCDPGAIKKAALAERDGQRRSHEESRLASLAHGSSSRRDSQRVRETLTTLQVVGATCTEGGERRRDGSSADSRGGKPREEKREGRKEVVPAQERRQRGARE